MTKSVLVIDTPWDCEECPLYDADLMRCHYLKNEAYGVDALPSWCPLKPMPHKLQSDWYTDGYKEGFNACLDELEGK